MKIFVSPVWRQHAIAGLTALLLLPAVAKAADLAINQNSVPAGSESNAKETLQPKLLWGALIKLPAVKAFEVFFQWSDKQISQGVSQTLVPRGAAVSAPGAAIVTIAQKASQPILPNVTDNPPTAPFAVAEGKENYQGAILSLLVLQVDGQSYAVRPVSAGFKSGEKFRIRIGATFDSELSLDNIDPKNSRSRLYPEDATQIVKIKSGTPVILPLDKDSFFQFDDDTGEEKLVVTLRDPRAQGNAASKALVHRQENQQGTGLLQEVAAGRFAVIAESIALQHRQ
jgi:hypothetical protein